MSENDYRIIKICLMCISVCIWIGLGMYYFMLWALR